MLQCARRNTNTYMSPLLFERRKSMFPVSVTSYQLAVSIQMPLWKPFLPSIKKLKSPGQLKTPVSPTLIIAHILLGVWNFLSPVSLPGLSILDARFSMLDSRCFLYLVDCWISTIHGNHQDGGVCGRLHGVIKKLKSPGCPTSTIIAAHILLGVWFSSSPVSLPGLSMLVDPQSAYIPITGIDSTRACWFSTRHATGETWKPSGEEMSPHLS